MKITINAEGATLPKMFTDYPEMGTLQEIIKALRPTEIEDIGKIHYGTDPEGWEYADIGWCLPSDVAIVTEEWDPQDPSDATVAVPAAVRFYLGKAS